MSTPAMYPGAPGPGGRSPRFRSVLDSFVPYKPGGGAPTAARLCSNESPDGPLPSVLAVIAAAAMAARTDGRGPSGDSFEQSRTAAASPPPGL